MDPAAVIMAALGLGNDSSWDVNEPDFLGSYVGQAVVDVRSEPQSSGIREESVSPQIPHRLCEVSEYYHPRSSATRAHAELLPAWIILHLDARATCLTSLAAVPLPSLSEKAQLSLQRRWEAGEKV